MRDCVWKVLLVEDDGDTAEALMAVFCLHGIETLWAIDGRAAIQTLDSIQRLGERPPDFALLDMNLPGTDTVELGQELRDHPIGCPVVMISASPEQILERSASSAGAIAALRKPFSIDCLLEIFDRYLITQAIHRPREARR